MSTCDPMTISNYTAAWQMVLANAFGELLSNYYLSLP